jgi:hypothetical protein
MPVAANIPWVLSSTGQERIPKIVYLRFLGAGDAPLGTATDDIVLDTTPPTVAAAELLDRSGRRYKVRVAALDPVSGVGRVQFDGGRKRPRTGQAPLLTRAYAGRTIVFRGSSRPRWYRASDRAGNWSAWAPVRRPAG